MRKSRILEWTIFEYSLLFSLSTLYFIFNRRSVGEVKERKKQRIIQEGHQNWLLFFALNYGFIPWIFILFHLSPSFLCPFLPLPSLLSFWRFKLFFLDGWLIMLYNASAILFRPITIWHLWRTVFFFCRL